MNNLNFDYKTFISKYREGIEKSGKSRLNFYDYIIPKLVSKNKPLYIIETGTMWCPFESNMGAFTLIMADLIKNYTGGRIYTIDISDVQIGACKSNTREFSDVIEYVVSDSVSYLKSLDPDFVKSLDLVYLDSYDLNVFDPHICMQHHLNELMALYENLNEDCGIGIDDNYLPGTWVMWNWHNSDGSVRESKRFETHDKIVGKGTYCNDFLTSNGWKRFKELDVPYVNNLFYYEKSKKELVTIITSHPNNEHRVEVLKNTIKGIKTKIILSVNYPVSEEIQKICDYVVYDGENQVLRKSEFNSCGVRYFRINSDGTEADFEFEHSYAVYRLIKNALEFASGLGYEKVYFRDYDYELTEATLNEQRDLLGSYDCVVYGEYNPSWGVKTYNSACWAAKINKILPAFKKYNTKFDYYRSGSGPHSVCFLELKLAHELGLLNLNIKEISSAKLASENKVNLVSDSHW